MDSKRLNLMMSVLKIALVALGVIAFFLVLNGPNMDQEEAVREEFLNGGKLAFSVGYTGFILFLGVGLILLFFVMQLITNTKKTLKSIMALLIAGLVFLIFYLMGTSDTNETLQLKEAQHVEPGTIAGTTAGLYTVMGGVIVGFLVWILSPFMGRFRN